MLIFPWLSDNIVKARKPFLMISALMQCAILLFICLHKEHAVSFTGLTVLGALFTIFTNCMGPISFTMVKESVPSSALASATGFINCSAPVFAAVIQGVFGSVIAGMMRGGTTSLEAYASAFLLLLAGSVIALGTTFFMKDTLKKEA
jgi:MFS family permease